MQGFKTAQPSSQLYCHSSFLLRFVVAFVIPFCLFISLYHSSCISLCATRLCRFGVGKFLSLLINRASLFWNRGNDANRNPTTGFCDLGDLHHTSTVFHQEDGVDLGSSNPLSLYLVAPFEQNEHGFKKIIVVFLYLYEIVFEIKSLFFERKK